MVPTDGFHDRAAGFEDLLGRRGHHGQRAALGPAEATTDRRVDQIDAASGQPGADLACLVWHDGRGKQDRRPPGHRVDKVRHHVTHLRAVHDHHKDSVGLLADLADTDGRLAPQFLQSVHTALIKIETDR